MLKTIKIGSKNYDMKSSAWTPFKYKNEYGKDLLKEIGKLNKINGSINKLPKEEQDTAWLSEFSEILEMALRMAYTMITEQNKDFMSYQNWLEGIDDLFDDNTWISEVMELAMSTFRGRVPNNK